MCITHSALTVSTGRSIVDHIEYHMDTAGRKACKTVLYMHAVRAARQMARISGRTRQDLQGFLQTHAC